MQTGCHEIIRDLSFMINHEPSVQGAVRLMQSFCLVGGIQLKYDGTTPPTPRFLQHLQRHYLPFCRNVIESFLTVGFAPYRIRTLANGIKIPELLPVGTYTWHVARNVNNMGQWGSLETPNKKQQTGDIPFLRYEINSMYCSDPIYVHVFVEPQAFFLCSSPLASLLNCYEHLLNKRECAYRADKFNSQASVVMERHSKVGGNAHNPGEVIAINEAQGKLRLNSEVIGANMCALHNTMESMQSKTNLPPETVTIVPPSEYAVHSLDRVLSPQEMLREELSFTRQVAIGCGIPCAMLLQGGGSIGASATSASNTNAWAEGIEGSNRLFLDTCRNMNSHLQELLYNIYKRIYGINQNHAPTFMLPLVPTIPFDQLMLAYQNQIVDDISFSRMLEATWGVKLCKEASDVRNRRQKAEYELPFRDKKETNS